jgi:hypothetical protein
MSGSKSAEWELDTRAEALVNAKRELDNTLIDCRTLLENMRALFSALIDASAEETVISTRLDKYRKRAKYEIAALEERYNRAKSIVLPAAAGQVSMGKLSMAQEIVQGISHAITDSSLSGAMSRLQRINRDLLTERERASSWMPEKHNELEGKQSLLLADIERIRMSLAKGGDAKEAQRQISSLEKELALLEESVYALSVDVESREKSHGRRLYVLKALRETCAKLGFEEIEEPDYERKGNRNSAIVQGFDTFNRGVILFKIHLDGHIDSDSGMITGACKDEYGKLSRLLLEEYGVAAEFRREGEDDLPKVIDTKRRPLPNKRQTRGISRGA